MITQLDIIIISSVVTAMWAGLTWLVYNGNKQGIEREKSMAVDIAEMRRFHQDTLVRLVETTNVALTQHTAALQANTKATEELEGEIKELRLEAAKRQKKREGDSGII